MAALRISFLGSFQITHDRQGEVPFTNRKVMGLLAFLALEAGQAHSRETLMGLLWPEMSEADARNNLRVTLARLRKRLADGTAVPPLTTSRTDARFRLDESIILDVAAFQALLAQTESHAHADRATCPDCRERLAAAVALYQGPLLHGLYLDDCPAFDEWLFVQRERFHLQALDVLEELAQGLEGDGRFAAATTHTRRQLALDPLHDSAQRRLLRLLAYQGQTAAALSQFESIKKTLHAELGIEPDVELLQLAQQIKEGTLLAPGMSAAKSVAARQATAAPRHNLPEILTPFIGRETELVQLAERLASPAYRLITLVGPGGIGKTRLALEAETYLNWSYFVLEFSSDPRQARVYLDKAFASAAGLADPELQGQLFAESGRNYLSDGQFDEAVAAFQKSLTLFESLGHISGKAAAYHFLAATYAEAHNPGPALTSGLEALRLRSQLNNRGRLGNTHLYLTDIYLLLGTYQQAKEHIQVSLEIARQLDNKVQEAYVLFGYARVLERLGQTEEAERAYRPAIAALKQLKFNAELKQALLNWGDFLLRTGRLAEAEISFDEALILNRDVDYLRLATQTKLAQVYLAQGKSEAALALADEVWRAIEQTGGRGLPLPIHTMVECHTIFQACGDERAGAALQMAAAVMKRTAVAIEDPEMRASFLNNVPVNRQLRAALKHIVKQLAR